MLLAEFRGAFMNVLITGANGQLGQEFQKLFTNEHISFIPTDYKELDITDIDAIRKIIKENKFTHIINCAAYNAVDKAEEDWRTAYSVNGLAVRNLAIAANEISAEIVHYSTDYVFDGKKDTPYTIYDDPNPINKYGESKFLGEKNIALANKYYLLRVSWVFGTGNINFAKKVIGWSKKTDHIRISDDEISSPTYAVDLVKATLEILKKKVYGLYHVSNTSCSRYDWGKYILEKINWKGKLERAKALEFNLPAKRPGYSVLDNYGLNETIGYEMPTWQNATDRFLVQLIANGELQIEE